MWYSLPAYFLFPFLFMIPVGYIIFMKGAIEATSSLTYLGNCYNSLSILFLQFCAHCAIATIHYWSRKVLHYVPPLLVNIFFAIFYVIHFGFTVYDFESTRHNLNMIFMSTYRAYMGRYGMKEQFSVPPLYEIIGGGIHANSAAAVAVSSVLDNPTFWFGLGIVILSFIIMSIYITYCNRGSVLLSSVSNQKIVLKGSFVDHTESTLVIHNQPFPEEASREKLAKTIKNVIYFFAAIDVIYLTLLFLIPNDRKIAFYAHIPYIHCLMLALTHFEAHPIQKVLSNVNQFSRGGYLPNNRYWLDDREDPTFPAVHADRKTYCAYNPLKCNQSEIFQRQKPLENPPNIVIVEYESLTPFGGLINDDFIDEHVTIEKSDPRYVFTSTDYYKKSIMEGLHELSKTGITFSGLTSLGLPTLSGWHTLMTGLTPSQTSMNINDAATAHSDDIPSLMRHNGYRTFHISASSFDFDCTNLWVNRRPAREEAMIEMKCKEGYGDLYNDPLQESLMPKPQNLIDCSTPENQKKLNKLEKKIKKRGADFPKWFDFMASYSPSGAQLRAINVTDDPNRPITFIPDRIGSAQFRAHWQQQRKLLDRKGEPKRPIFGSVLTIESHMPYIGYDDPNFYDSSFTDDSKTSRFLRVNKYSDHYQIHELIKFLRENDPNTIVIVTGDHGTRDLPIREPGGKYTEKSVFDPECVHQSTGTDSFFQVSAVISYLGNNSEVKQLLHLDELSGKTVKVPCDHNDLMYTLTDLTSQFMGHSTPPTYRRSRNLIELAVNVSNSVRKTGSSDQIRNELDASKWQSLSQVTYQIEYHNGTRLLRTHTGDLSGAQYIEDLSYPTCILPTGSLGKRKETNNEMMDDLFSYLNTENYLLSQNRMFHYDFRDVECVENGKCSFPTTKPLEYDDSLFLGAVAILPPFFVVVLGIPLEIILLLIAFVKKTMKKDKISSESEDTELMIDPTEEEEQPHEEV